MERRDLKASGVWRAPSRQGVAKRWGSYTPNGGIVPNVDLIRVAPDLIDYVISHELAHCLSPDHGAEWRNFLTMVMPDWETRKERLEASVG
jgi:hypothetical protein